MSLYVDDALVISSDEATWAELHDSVTQRYKLSSVGNATLHLGLTIDYDCHAGVLALGNANYFEQLAARFGISLDVKLHSVTPFARPRTRLYPISVTEEPLVNHRGQLWAV